MSDDAKPGEPVIINLMDALKQSIEEKRAEMRDDTKPAPVTEAEIEIEAWKLRAEAAVQKTEGRDVMVWSQVLYDALALMHRLAAAQGSEARVAVPAGVLADAQFAERNMHYSHVEVRRLARWVLSIAGGTDE